MFSRRATEKKTLLKMATLETSPVASDEEKNDGSMQGRGPQIDETSSVGAADDYEGYVIDRTLEKKMLRKFDFIILRT